MSGFDELDAAELGWMLARLAAEYARNGLSREAERVQRIGAGVRRTRGPAPVAFVDEAGCVPPSWVTVTEAACDVGVSRQAVEKRISTGRLRHARDVAGVMRVDPDSLDEWRAERAERRSA